VGSGQPVQDARALFGLRSGTMCAKTHLLNAIIFIFIVSVSANHPALSDDESAANAAIVQASLMVVEARTARDDYQALLWYDDTLRLLDHLIDEYPGSPVAVKLTTGHQIGSIDKSDIIFERDTIRAKLPGLNFRDCRDCPEMVVVTGGVFDMGSPDTEVGRWDNETPLHNVALPTFAIGVYETTFDDWTACLEDRGCGGYDPSDQAWGRGKRPVINVSWHEAVAFTDWLSEETGLQYRLATEAEWEYAARAGSSTAFPWGDGISEGRAVCSDCGTRWDKFKTANGDKLESNAFGLHHTVGNVWEWVADCYDDDFEQTPVDGAAMARGHCDLRVIRGGAYISDVRDVRSASRFFAETGKRSKRIGFRVARDLP